MNRLQLFGEFIKSHPAQVFIVIYGIALRYLYVDIPSTVGPESAPSTRDTIGYFETLANHFWEYLYYTNLKPPVIYVIHGVVAKINDLTSIGIGIQLFILVSICNIVGVLFLYKLIKTYTNRHIAFIISIVFVTALIPFEEWWSRAFYMHFAFFLTMYFINSLAGIVGKAHKSSEKHLIISSVLMVLSNGVNAVLIPATILLFQMLQIEKKALRQYIKKSVLLVSVPIVATLLLCSKNYIASGVFSPSNLGGGAFALVTMRALDRDSEKLIPYLEKYDVPEWYIWCFSKSKEVSDVNQTLVNTRVFGYCYNSTGNPADYDLDEILQIARKSGDRQIINAVLSDINTVEKQPYLLNGFSGRVSLKWSNAYMAQSGEIAFKHFKENPRDYIPVIKSLSKQLIYGGAKFLPRKVKETKTENEILNKWVSVNGFLLGLMIALGLLCVILISPLLLITSVIKTIKAFKNNVDVKIEPITIIALTMSCASVILVILFSTIVGEENDRYMMYIFPYIIIAGVMLIRNFFNRKTTHG